MVWRNLTKTDQILGYLFSLDLEMHVQIRTWNGCRNPTNGWRIAWVCIKLYTQWLTLNRHNCKEAVDQHIITKRWLRLPITKQTFNKNLEYVIDDWTQWQAQWSHDLSLSGLLIELRKIISSPNWANAWLGVQVDGLNWYVIRILLGKKKIDYNLW